MPIIENEEELAKARSAGMHTKVTELGDFSVSRRSSFGYQIGSYLTIHLSKFQFWRCQVILVTQQLGTFISI